MMFSKLLGRWPADGSQSYVPYEHYYTPACPHCPVPNITDLLLSFGSSPHAFAITLASHCSYRKAPIARGT